MYWHVFTVFLKVYIKNTIQALAGYSVKIVWR